MAAPEQPWLSAGQQRPLKILGEVEKNGAGEAALLVHGCWREMLAELVLAGPATAVTDTMQTSPSTIKVERYRITDDGRKALKD